MVRLLVLIMFVAFPLKAADKIIQFDPELFKLIDVNSKITTLSTGHTWLEGPVWDKKRNTLYFSDVPMNKSYSWSANAGVKVFMNPSAGDTKGDKLAGPQGSNGLFMWDADHLLIANNGRRNVEKMSLLTMERSTVQGMFDGKRFNSPNDLVKNKAGDVFFTDPPYGLPGLNASPLKQLDFNGVYVSRKSGELSLIDDSLTFPNGIALSPDEQFLYVSVSDPSHPVLYRYSRGENGAYAKREKIFDAKPYLDKGYKGLPDGMVITASGHIFLTGPGGVFILNAAGKALGLIKLDTLTANCTFGEDDKTLFITSHTRLLKMKTKVSGM